MSRIGDNIVRITAQLPEGVALVAVSKFHPAEAIAEAYEAGQRIFGESRAQELAAKAPHLPADIEWHFIGHLQTNKVRQVIGAGTALIHSIDSEHLLRMVDSEAVKAGRRIGVLLQVHVAREETKFGFTPQELLGLAASGSLAAPMQGAEIRGVMGMASNVDDTERITADFSEIRRVFDLLREGPFAGRPEFSIVSMGMSHDWPIAAACGSTHVRIGTAIFGDRQY